MARIDELSEQFKGEYPDIDPFQDDWDWRFQAKLSLQMGRLDAAEELFKKLIVSRPVHHEGYEGLAGVYLELDNPDALPLILKAYELAISFAGRGALEPKALEAIEKKKAEIEKKVSERELSQYLSTKQKSATTADGNKKYGLQPLKKCSCEFN